MFDLSVKNISGDVLRLTRNNNYAITGVSGLTPVAANINTSTAGINDGVVYNSARLSYRNIVITLCFARNVETSRIKLYDYFQTKQFCRLYFSNGSRDVYIDGYVETFECDLFTMTETAQISIICPKPYFKSVMETINSGTIETAETTVTIPNNGDVPVGMNIELNFSGSVSAPVIRNTVTGEYFQLNRDFVSGDKVTVNTRSGEKSVILAHSGVDFNIINALDPGTSWPQLQRGNNTLLLDANSGATALSVTFKHYDLFAGV